MGNDQSRAAGKEEVEGPLDYYELLQVDIEATGEEIKKSYRRLALQNHPDKNPHRIEEATKIFADLQQAYEVLSDPNERAFYDRHRNDHIETTEDDFYDHVRAGDAGISDPKSKFNRRRRGDPGIRLEQLMRFFDPKLARKMDDSNEGFFSVYRTLFNVLASDEVLHTPEEHVPVNYPAFGDSSTPYAPPPGMPKSERIKSLWARDFYTAWGEFTTEKRFEWVDKWDTQKGEDRNIRRLMEKENKKVREEHRKEYIDTVRTLVSFIQHRDPRYKTYQAEQAKRKRAQKGEAAGSGTSTPRRNARRDAEAARKREEDRLKAAAQFEEQDWQRASRDLSEEEEEEEEVEEGDGTGIRLDDGQGGEIFECVACNKTFQSEASWSNHERSKKHKQAVWRMAKEMRAEAGAFDDEDFATPQENTPLASDIEDVAAEEDSLIDEFEEMEIQEAKDESVAPQPVANTQPSEPANPTPSPPSSPKPRKARGVEKLAKADGEDSDSASATSRTVPEMSKRDKRRAKEAKKKADEEAAKAAMKEDRKAAKKAQKAGVSAPPPTDNKPKAGEAFVQPKRKNQARGKKVEKVVITDQDIERAVADIKALREKMLEKWADEWRPLLKRLETILHPTGVATSPSVICLGLGKPYDDRTAKIQLAFLLELVAGLGHSSIEAFDPVFDEGDRRVLSSLGIAVIEDNLRGEHQAPVDRPFLVYMPHCSKTLYEAFFTTNFSPSLASPPVLLLGNDLAEYLPGFTRVVPGAEENGGEDEFVKPKKKRKGRGPGERQFEDSVLRRLVPHFDVFMLSELSETNLPGFARAFLSLGFQWLPSSKADAVDWATPLPAVEWPDDGEVR